MTNTQATTLKFFVSKNPIMDVTLSRHTIKHIEVHDVFAASIVLPERKRTYQGLEKQLQYYLNNEQSLPEIIVNIQKHGFKTQIHRHLKIKIA